MFEVEIKEVRDEDLFWDYRSGVPYHAYAGWSGKAELDPIPSYSHKREHAQPILDICVEKFPPLNPLTLWLANKDELGRTNGFSQRCWDYRNQREDGSYPRTSHIYLCAKRIPLHPAMTRYLVAHEYGHHIQWWAEIIRGMDEQPFEDAYSELRTGTHNGHGSPGRWHNSAAEVFACDFRILVAGVETEFWPHDTIPYPTEVPAVVEWWAKLVEEREVFVEELGESA